jgi:hypothetical protein
LRGDPVKEANAWLDKIADVDRQRARAQDLAVERLLRSDELRAKLVGLEETRETAKRELETLQCRNEEVEELKHDRDALLEHYVGTVPEGLEALGPEERRWVYKLLHLSVFADADGNLSVTGMFTRASAIQEDTRQDEGNNWGRLGEVLGRPGREDEARAAYEMGIQQAEKYGHGGMADELRAALVGLGEKACRGRVSGKTEAGMWGIIKKIRMFCSSPRTTPLGGARRRARLLLRCSGMRAEENSTVRV